MKPGHRDTTVPGQIFVRDGTHSLFKESVPPTVSRQELLQNRTLNESLEEQATWRERRRCIAIVLKALEHALKHGEPADVILALHNVATDLELKP